MHDENELIKRAKDGDTWAFESLIEPYQKMLLNFTYRMMKTTEDAEDITQEVFIKAYRAIARFDGKSSFKTWLYKIASNACMDELRKRKSRGTDNQVSLSLKSEDGEYELPVEDKSAPPEEIARKNEARRVLTAAIEELSEEHKSVVIMRDLQGFSYEEIAKVTNSAVGTVKSRLARARLYLRKILEKDRELFFD